MKKIGLILLAFCITFSSVVPVSATSTTETNGEKIVTYVENDTITDEYGNSYNLEFTEYTYSDNSLKLRSMSNSNGERKVFSFRISNNDLGFPSIVAGTPFTEPFKRKLANVVATKISARLGANIIPGINLVSWLLTSAAFINGRMGNNGFQIDIETVYRTYYSHRENLTISGWDFESVSLYPY